MDANRNEIHWDMTATVSIHAPVMDANLSCLYKFLFISFNPRARDGREIHLPRHSRLAYRFNPRARDGREWGLTY